MKFAVLIEENCKNVENSIFSSPLTRILIVLTQIDKDYVKKNIKLSTYIFLKSDAYMRQTNKLQWKTKTNNFKTIP